LYQYSASGVKLRETIGSNYSDYLGNIIKKNDVLYQISHDEGRIIDGEYEYNIKDHLGNLRVAFRDSLGIAKISQHYAYGVWGEDMPTMSYTKQAWKADNFRFTGKENLQGTGFIDFGARWYDNLVPRFTTIDPLSELSRRFSPTVYGNDNPVLMIDPDGMKSINSIQKAWHDTAEGSSSTWNNNGDGSFSDGGGEVDKDKGKKEAINTAYGQTGIAVGSVGGMTVGEAIFRQNLAKNGKPDRDGVLTYFEAREWSHYGNGEALTINASSIDLSNVYYIEVPFEGKGNPLRVNLLSPNRFTNTGEAIVHGNILLVKDQNGRVKILSPNAYDFEVGGAAHPWTGENSQVVRNIATILGAIVNGGSGKAFDIVYTGYANVSPGSPPTKK
jgi:RHS repeat-associated protein